jgi:integrase
LPRLPHLRPVLRRRRIVQHRPARQQRRQLPDIRFHDLRHTHATGLLAQGHSIKAVSQRLGHASVELTLRVYAHVLPTDDGALAEGLDRMFG